jgi:hypothetical protein
MAVKMKGSQSAPPPASARVPTPLPKVTSRMVMQYSGGDETVLQARSMVMKARERLYEKCPAFFSFILSTMTAPSRAVVQGHPDFLEAHTSSDVFNLLRIVKGTHLINLEAEAMRMEKKLQEMRLILRPSKFHYLIIGLDNVGSKLSTERIVFIFLFSLKSSPLQGAADRLLNDPEQEGDPDTFEKARNRMHLAWINQSSSLLDASYQ